MCDAILYSHCNKKMRANGAQASVLSDTLLRQVECSYAVCQGYGCTQQCWPRMFVPLPGRNAPGGQSKVLPSEMMSVDTGFVALMTPHTPGELAAMPPMLFPRITCIR